jgi:hypothetical protein
LFLVTPDHAERHAARAALSISRLNLRQMTDAASPPTRAQVIALLKRGFEKGPAEGGCTVRHADLLDLRGESPAADSWQRLSVHGRSRRWTVLGFSGDGRQIAKALTIYKAAASMRQRF